jgi:hypothetical protein
MNAYQNEQFEALFEVRKQLLRMRASTKSQLDEEIQPYLDFRRRLEVFSGENLGKFCTQACFESQTSACCSKDGIITFWADVVINVICSTDEDLAALVKAIKNPAYPNKCIYLSAKGCLWKVRPLVCAMFVCDQVHRDVIDRSAELKAAWEMHRKSAKSFRWPDRPVLFDRLEAIFIDQGCQSPLMYINNSPGLLRIKQKAGLMKTS